MIHSILPVALLLAACAHDASRYTASEHRAADQDNASLGLGPYCGTAYSRHILRDRLHRPRRDDPFVLAAVKGGMDRESAEVARAINVVNGCDE